MKLCLWRSGYIILRFFFVLFRNRVKITCSHRDDGGGAQIHACLSALLLAHDFGLEYCHTPFVTVSHKPKYIDTADWAMQWNSYFLGLPLVEKIQPLPTHYTTVNCLSLSYLLKQILLNPRRGVIYSIPHAHSYADLFPNRYDKVLIKRQPSLPSCRGKKLVIHLRRGDVQMCNQNSARYTSSEYVLCLIDFLIMKNNSSDLVVHVLSNEYCPILAHANYPCYKFDCESSVFEALSLMISADILVMAKSSMSYVAALFCTGTIFYQPFWHSKKSFWKVFNSG